MKSDPRIWDGDFQTQDENKTKQMKVVLKFMIPPSYMHILVRVHYMFYNVTVSCPVVRE